ncbi:MAG: glycosyltransferase [Lentisphaerae bacterium]|jgi:colanic acid/amylovoran biosynthesis glycosyltransferase|nr:glycosyltransferase [Lentisphaerota bacterium]MBT4821791.1 glycosyltransferase [Lentisphaerota bacterium]MBT5609261.1 glycosyltransferase [Lentisphaerota bacterium]MBT7059445.1 glycosyltransferase [Lentisphaerota bacterium]MBT7847829.1 glycosyltransferase [Lentisphaerota bacterium]
MEVAYLVSEYPARSHTFIRREIAQLRQRGAKIHIFSVRSTPAEGLLTDIDRAAFDETWKVLPVNPFRLVGDHLAAFVSAPGKYLRTLSQAWRHRLPGIREGLWSLFYFAEAIRLARELERRQLKHLHVHFANAGATVGFLAAGFAGLSWSMNLHGACDFEFPAGPLLGEKLRSVTFSNCSSHFVRAQALRTIPPEHWDKLFVSRCGIELETMPNPVARQDDGSRLLRVISVGRLSSEKGQLGLIKAFALARGRGMEAELVLVGDGPDRGLVESEIAAHHLQDCCHLRGSLAEQDCLAEIAQGDIFALPSLMEGVPLVLMEAMVLNVPVIAPRIAGIPELVEDGVSGVLYDPADWEGLAQALADLAADIEKRKELTVAAQHKVLAEFVIHKAVDPLCEALRSATTEDANANVS